MEYFVRKINRLPQDCYKCPDTFFVTVCTKNKENLFWISNKIILENGTFNVTKLPLTAAGKTVDNVINSINEHYPSVFVVNYTVMPNHVHLLLEIRGNDDNTVNNDVSISTVINQMKRKVSISLGYSPWQKGFYDHIIRSQKDYENTWDYIESNPINISSDIYYKF